MRQAVRSSQEEVLEHDMIPPGRASDEICSGKDNPSGRSLVARFVLEFEFSDHCLEDICKAVLRDSRVMLACKLNSANWISVVYLLHGLLYRVVPLYVFRGVS